MQSVIVVLVSVLTLTACLPAGVFVGEKGDVGASWGGYSASAGLGGIVSGNGVAKGGLHASAGTPDGHIAAAGLGGSAGGDSAAGGLYSFAQSGSSASASASNHVTTDNKIRPTKSHGSLFDDIFNIPQSVLRSVNDLLNKRAQGQKVGSVSTSASAASATADGGATRNSINLSGNGGATKYDDIFNIPQSVLGAVNRLLNRF